MNNNLFWSLEGFTPSGKKLLRFDYKQLKFIGLYLCFALMFWGVCAFSTSEGTIIAIRILAVINQAVMIIRNVSRIKLKEFSLKSDLPLHLCNLNVIVITVFVFTLDVKLLDFLLSFSIFGAVFAILTPNTDYARYPKLCFWSLEFFFTHTCLILIPLVARYILKMPYSFDNYLFSMGMVAAISVLCIIVNVILKSNYFFICHAPDKSPLTPVENKLGGTLYSIIYLSGLAFVCALMHLLLG